MNFIDAIKTCFNKYADFDGTASRSEFWWFFLFTMVAPLILGAFSKYFTYAFNLAVFLPSLAVGTRRLHETDRSGWWQLLWFVPVVGWIVIIVFLTQEGRSNRHAGAADINVTPV